MLALATAASLLLAAPVADVLDPAVPTPKAVLGYEIGDYHTDYHGVVRYAEALARAVPERVRLVPIGESYERRPMFLLVISSPANVARLGAIQADLARLGDPRTLSEDEAQQIVKRSPAVSWDNFGNDGNESAAVEAALEMAYRLAAARGGEIEQALGEVVAVIDVCHNPESRERFVAWYNAHQVGPQGSADPQAIEHRGPWGMDNNNNHYQTDLNRDSVWATQQETRNLIRAYQQWNPQTFVDHHGETENFFFPPVALPVNPNIPQFQLDWLTTYGRAIADVADRHGWSYFTAEVFDEFYAGYWDAYPFFKGAIGFTFETNAGGSAGLRMERDDETVMTLRDGVLRHVEGGLAVLLTTAAQRERKLADYWRFRKSALEEGRQGAVKGYAIVPGADRGRAADVVETLMFHGVEVERLDKPLTLRGRDYLARETKPRALPAGSYMVRLDQPEKRLIQAMLEPASEQQAEFLEQERSKRAWNRQRGAKVPADDPAFYDVTAWAVPYAYGLEAYELLDVAPAAERLQAPPPAAGAVAARARQAYLFDPREQGSAKLAFALLREGHKLAVARKPFTLAGRGWPAGTYVARIERNDPTLHERIAALAGEAGVRVAASDTQWTEKGIDLGSSWLDSLKEPSLAVLTDAPTDATSYGTFWFWLERRLGQPFTALRTADVAGADLSRYTAILVPDGSPVRYRMVLGAAGLAKLGRFADDGGALVLVGGASELATDKKTGWTKARLLGVIEKEPERGAEEAANGAPHERDVEPAPDKADARAGGLETEKDLAAHVHKREDEVEFTPGAIFAADLEPGHFLRFGYDDAPLPVQIASARVFAASPSGANVVRLRRDKPRLAGFAWPEAEARLRGAAYLIEEPRGRGRVILFAEDVLFRNYWRGLETLVANALLLGPSL